MFLVENGSYSSDAVNLTDIGLDSGGLGILRIYNLLVIIIGVFGNMLVLSGLLDSRVMSTEPASRVLLQNLAFTDILYTLAQFTPPLVTLLTRTAPFSHTTCLVDHIAASVFAVNQIHVILFLSCYRLWLIHQPLKPRQEATARRGMWWFVGGWMLHDVVVHVAFHASDLVTVGYDEQILSCSIVNKRNYWIPTILSLYNIAIPIMLTIVANVFTVCAILKFYTTKQHNRPYRKATLTILAISLTFLLSYTPFMVQMVAHNKTHFPAWYRTASMFSLSINLVCNPFIYAICDRAFLQYTRDLLLGLLLKIGSCADWCNKRWSGLEWEDEWSNEYNYYGLRRMSNTL